jgi:hypothetical protein
VEGPIKKHSKFLRDIIGEDLENIAKGSPQNADTVQYAVASYTNDIEKALNNIKNNGIEKSMGDIHELGVAVDKLDQVFNAVKDLDKDRKLDLP